MDLLKEGLVAVITWKSVGETVVRVFPEAFEVWGHISSPESEWPGWVYKHSKDVMRIVPMDGMVIDHTGSSGLITVKLQGETVVIRLSSDGVVGIVAEGTYSHTELADGFTHSLGTLAEGCVIKVFSLESSEWSEQIDWHSIA